MKLRKFSIFKIFHYIWLILALFLILYIISKNIVVQRDINYKLDFNKPITKDITGWYPESRAVAINDRLHILNEPLYLKVYSPINFNNLLIKGSIEFKEENIKIGIKQKDYTYLYKDLIDSNINLNFDLDNVLIVGNKIELILSIPEINKEKNINFNNLEIILTR